MKDAFADICSTNICGMIVYESWTDGKATDLHFIYLLLSDVVVQFTFSQSPSILFPLLDINHRKLNKFNFQLVEAACLSTFYSDDVFEDLLSSKDLAFQLVETYYECVLSFQDNIMYAVGISTGNASVGCSLVMFLSFLLLGECKSAKKIDIFT